MYAITWDEVGERLYETGVDRGVFYGRNKETGAYDNGEAWNGLSSVTESPSGAETTPVYADNIKYLSLISVEELGGTIEAYMYPEGFGKCDGSEEVAPGVHIGQQNRETFGLCYRSILGNDTELNNYGYKLHLIYGCQVSPSERAYQTVNDSPEAATLSWTLTTTPVPVTGYKPTASMVIDSTKVDAAKLAALEDILYGKAAVPPTTEGGDDGVAAVKPRLPMPDEIISLLSTANASVG